MADRLRGLRAFVAVGMLAVLMGREPATRPGMTTAQTQEARRGGLFNRVWLAAKGAFGEFLSQDAAIAVLIFVILYKLCDALAGAMTGPFVLAGLGYDKATYAGIVKGVGLVASLAGGFAGGFVARALPLTQALWLGAFLQMLSNGVFIWLGWQDKSAWALTVAIIIENFAGAIGTVIFVAYLSALCRNPAAYGHAIRAADGDGLDRTHLPIVGHGLCGASRGLAAIFRGHHCCGGAEPDPARMAAAAGAF